MGTSLRPFRRGARPATRSATQNSFALASRLLVGLVTLSLLGVGGFLGACQPASEEPRPNVLFVVIDDLNDWIEPLGGHPDAHTPHLSSLAQRSVNFQRAYANSSACNPSRTSLLTGRLPSSTGVYWNGQPMRAALPDALSLPQRLRQEGYETVAFGKVFHERDPQSWDRFDRGGRDPRVPNRPLNDLQGSDRFFDWGTMPAESLRKESMVDERVIGDAIEFLRRRESAELSRPFFLAVGLHKPHLPWIVPEEYFEPWKNAPPQLPEVPAGELEDIPKRGLNIANPDGDHARVTTAGQWTEAVTGYLASVNFIDAQLGRLLQALDASEHAQDTVIVLLSDHGYHLGEKEHWRKTTLWEEGLRIPLLIAPPGRDVDAPRGVDSPRVVTLVDVYPTLLELTQATVDAGADGRSLAPLLSDPDLAWPYPGISMIQRDFSARTERWRYIQYGGRSDELYDHELDPGEHNNLADDPRYGEVKRDLAGFFPQDPKPRSPTQRELQERAAGQGVQDPAASGANAESPSGASASGDSS
ncbi:MAG: sulfatase [Acidobacteriota bacterium]